MRRSSILSLAILFAMTNGCSDDGLAGGFEKGDSDEPPFEEGALIPIEVGDTLWYSFFHTYRRTTAAGRGGLNEGEKQTSGNMCIKVTEVRDTATEEYHEAAETVIGTQVKINGGFGQAQMVISDQDDPANPDATVIDAAVANLWLKKMAVPSRGHPFSNPAAKDFHTRTAPVPPDHELAHLPFFDVRITEDKSWGGWTYYNADCLDYSTDNCPLEQGCKVDRGACDSATESMQGKILLHFLPLTTSPDRERLINMRPTYSALCETHTTLTACQQASCTWDFTAEECITLYSIELLWRETVGTGPIEMQGPVLHKLRLEYNSNGTLRSAAEIMIPDLDPDGPLPSEVTACLGDQPCANGIFELDDRDWSQAHCTF